MKRLPCLSTFLSAYFFGATCWAVSLNTGEETTAVQKLAAGELRLYSAKMFSAFSGKDEEPQIVIGTPNSNAEIQAAVEKKLITLPTGKNLDQGYSIKTVGNTIHVAGHTDVGVLYGVYALLEEYGAYFQISGERLPEKKAFVVKPLDVNVSPVFKYRGLLPWDNFLCGMSGWDLEHYQKFIDRATRMKLNLFQFHFYPGFAFYTDKWNGKDVDPKMIGGPVDVFPTKGAIGEKGFNGIEIFGNRSYIENIGNPRAQARAVQSMMNGVIEHVHGTGGKTCVGFELMYPEGGDFSQTEKPADANGGMNFINPIDPKNVEKSLERYRHLVETYPKSDYYWIWNSEGRGFLSRNIGHEAGAAEMRAKTAHWVGNPLLAGDVDFAFHFREVAKRLTPDERSKLATGGWSIEHTFPGMHADFPPEVIFASLNAPDPRHSQKNQVPSYAVAKEGRRAWMIEWWEFDGSQWFPQFRVGWQEKMYQMCAEFGVENVSLLGWKLSGVEHNIRYLSEFSWNPKLTASDFYRTYVERLYGKNAGPIAALFEKYDRDEPDSPGAVPTDVRPMLLGMGWAALIMPPLPAKPESLEDPAWKTIVKESAGTVSGIAAQEKLLAMDTAAVAQFRSLLDGMEAQGREWAQVMVNRLEFRCLYLESMIALNQSFIKYDEVARAEGFEKASLAAAKDAKVAQELARQAIEKYAENLPDRTDQGVIAQLNEQYYVILRRYHDGLIGADSRYVALDWSTFRITPSLACDFAKNVPWKHRDGAAEMSLETVEGKPTLRLAFGDGTAPFNSVALTDSLDLEVAPFLDFWIRTTSKEPLAFLLEIESNGVSQWRALNLIGKQNGYAQIDTVPQGKINDGKWHRVTWDLLRLCKEELGTGSIQIKNLVLGTWEKPSEPVVVEFQNFSHGKRNTLD